MKSRLHPTTNLPIFWFDPKRPGRREEYGGNWYLDVTSSMARNEKRQSFSSRIVSTFIHTYFRLIITSSITPFTHSKLREENDTSTAPVQNEF
jgi:hypothetical protein